MKIAIVNESGFDNPVYATEGSVGIDLRASINNNIKDISNGNIELVSDAIGKVYAFFLLPGGRAIIPTGIKIALPKNYELQIRPRSGLSLKHGIITILGTIDSDYRGEIGLIVTNISNTKYLITNGDKIAQGVLSKISNIEWINVIELSNTDRNENGFGSTGK